MGNSNSDATNFILSKSSDIEFEDASTMLIKGTRIHVEGTWKLFESSALLFFRQGDPLPYSSMVFSNSFTLPDYNAANSNKTKTYQFLLVNPFPSSHDDSANFNFEFYFCDSL